MKYLKLASIATALVLSSSVNASIVNTLNGVDYEWLELTATVGMSRDQVEAGILAATEGDALYGYEYASRQLVEDMLLSYASFDGIDGWHGDPDVVVGVGSLISDFGATFVGTPEDYVATITTVDGYTVDYEPGHYIASYGMYGLSDECYVGTSCITYDLQYFDMDSSAVMIYQNNEFGWNVDAALPAGRGDELQSSYPEPYGSYLVRVEAVPVPAAVWLFGSGLIGLICLARRKA